MDLYCTPILGIKQLTIQGSMCYFPTWFQDNIKLYFKGPLLMIGSCPNMSLIKYLMINNQHPPNSPIKHRYISLRARLAREYSGPNKERRTISGASGLRPLLSSSPRAPRSQQEKMDFPGVSEVNLTSRAPLEHKPVLLMNDSRGGGGGGVL